MACSGAAVAGIPLNSLAPGGGGPLAGVRTPVAAQGILRAGGLKALHDEDAIYEEELQRAQGGRWGTGDCGLVRGDRGLQGCLPRRARGGIHRLDIRRHPGPHGGGPLAAVGALMWWPRWDWCSSPAVPGPRELLEVRGGSHAHLVRLFWSAEGAGAHWPGNDLFILVVIAVTAPGRAHGGRAPERRLPSVGTAG